MFHEVNYIIFKDLDFLFLIFFLIKFLENIAVSDSLKHKFGQKQIDL